MTVTSVFPYIIDDGKTLEVSKFECKYRPPRGENGELPLESGCSEVKWLFPEETGSHQSVAAAKK